MAIDSDLTNPDLRGAAVKAARGERPFDLLIRKATQLDMVTGRERLVDIGVVGGLIASVHAPDEISEGHQIIEAEGLYATPGLIDSHMHIESSMVTPEVYAAHALSRGVTTIVWDPHELANVAGLAGMDYALEAARNTGMRILTLAPSCVPSAPGFEVAGGDFDASVIAKLLNRDDVHGAAELMTMQPLLNGDVRVKGIVDAALASGKRVCGHARGLSDRDLTAFAAAGVETDHELSSSADLLARLEAGMTVELRGSHEHLLPEFAKVLLSLGHMPQTVTLCTDDVFPDDLLLKGALDHMMRILISQGLPLWWVYKAATLNAATALRRPDLGLVAPGRRADILLLRDLAEVSSQHVISDGQIRYAPTTRHDTKRESLSSPVSDALTNSVKTKAFVPEDFEIKATGSMARVATLSKPRFPEWSERELAIVAGQLDVPADLTRMAVINRHGAATPVRLALLEHWGEWEGAYGATVSHDSHNLTVFGSNSGDMSIAANHLRDIGGGLTVVRHGEIVASLALPIAGLLSSDDLESVATAFANVRTAMGDVVDWHPPFLVFKALFGASLVCNKGPRLSDVGIVDVFEGRVLESCILASS